MNKKIWIFFAVLVIFFLVFFNSYPRIFNDQQISNSPDENLNLFFSQLKLEINSYSLNVSEVPEGVNESIFMLRDGAIYDGKIVPQSFFGIYLLGTTLNSIDRNIILIITPLIAILISLIIYLISREAFGEETAIISAIFILFLPFFWPNASVIFFNHFFSLFFYLIGILYFIKFIKYQNKIYLIPLTIFFAVSILFRYISLLIILPIILVVVFKLLKKAPKYILILLGIFFLILAPILILNSALYGDIFSTGYSVSLGIISEKTGVDVAPFQFNILQLKTYFINYFIKLIPLIFIFGTLGFLQIFLKAKKVKLKIIYLILVTLVFVILFLFFSGRIVSGYDSISLDSAMIKYMLPFYLLLIPLFSVYLRTLNRKVAFLLILLVVLGSFTNVIFMDHGILDGQTTYQKNLELKEFILGNTGESSIIISQLSDKVIFPNRIIIVAALIGAKDKEENSRKRSWLVGVDQNELSKVLFSFGEEGNEIYLLEDGHYFNYDELNSLLADKNYFLEKVAPSQTKITLYKLTKK